MKLSSFTKPSNSFSGNVLKLVSGTAFAQVLGILISPIITRLFAPEAYGVAALFGSITGIMGVIACLRYELAIMLPKTNEEAANIFGASLCATLLITLLSAMIVIWGKNPIIRLTNAPGLATYLWLIPVAVFFSGLFSALNYWNSRSRHFGRLSVAQILSAVTTQATRLTAGFAGFVSAGILIGANILGSVVTAGALLVQIWKDDKKLFVSNIRFKGILNGFVRYKKFPIIDVWGGLLNTISWQLPALMLSSFFSISVVGFYALGLTVVKAPLGVVSSALAQVFYQKAAIEKNVQGKNGELVENLMDRLMFIGVLPTFILSMVGTELFSVVFGARWAEAGRYTQILAPWLFFWFISSPLSTLFLVYERQGAALSVHFIIFITRFISLYIGGVYQNIYLALGLFSATGIAAYAFVAAWNIRLAQANEKIILISFFKHIFYASPVLICLFIIKYTFDFGPILILFSALIVMIFYLYIFRHNYVALITEFKK